MACMFFTSTKQLQHHMPFPEAQNSSDRGIATSYPGMSHCSCPAHVMPVSTVYISTYVLYVKYKRRFEVVMNWRLLAPDSAIRALQSAYSRTQRSVDAWRESKVEAQNLLKLACCVCQVVVSRLIKSIHTHIDVHTSGTRDDALLNVGRSFYSSSTAS